MRYDTIDPEFFVRNRANLAAKMKPNSVLIIHANDIMPTNADGVLPWRQNNDLFYLTGVDQEETVIVIYPDSHVEVDREILFVRETSEHIAIWEGEKLTKERAIEVSGVKNVQWVDSFEAAFHRLAPQVENIYLLTNEYIRASKIVETRNRRFITLVQAEYPLHRLERAAPLLQEL